MLVVLLDAMTCFSYRQHTVEFVLSSLGINAKLNEIDSEKKSRRKYNEAALFLNTELDYKCSRFHA